MLSKPRLLPPRRVSVHLSGLCIRQVAQMLEAHNGQTAPKIERATGKGVRAIGKDVRAIGKDVRANMKTDDKIRILHGETGLARRQYGSDWRDRRRSEGATLEIPISCLFVIFVCGVFFLATSKHTPLTNEVTYADFVENYLQRTDKIEIINRQYARVYLRPEVDSAALHCAGPHCAGSDDPRDSPCIVRDLDDLVRGPPFFTTDHFNPTRFASRKSRQALQRTILRRRRRALNVVSFQVGDMSKIEETLRGASGAVPRIFYRDEIDWIGLMRAYVPTVILTALAFSTFQTGVSLTPTIGGDSFNQESSGADKLLGFGKAKPLRSGGRPIRGEVRDAQLGRPEGPTATSHRADMTRNALKTGLAEGEIPLTRLDDVAGLIEVKKELFELIDFLKDPKKYRRFGAKIPRGFLLVGPPGTGKTLLAKAIAGEANVPFYSMNGSDFIELFVGVGPSRIRNLFQLARQNSPSIIFIDEIDTIGKTRSSANHHFSNQSDERESTLNALLVELDGFATPNPTTASDDTSESSVIVIGGTNRADVLDPALVRPGRFDRHISLEKPTVQERGEIFELYLRPLKLIKGLKTTEIAKRLAGLTPGLSGAEIRSVCNEAAILAARNSCDGINLKHFEDAVERTIGGLKKTGDVLDSALRKQVAYHEAGHAVLGWFLMDADPVLKLSIVPRASGSLGYTQILPDDVQLMPKSEVLTKICVLLGGKAAEEIFTGMETSGSADDLEKATKLAHTFVSALGFDEENGLLSLGSYRRPSDQTLNMVDQRIRGILKVQYDRALKTLKENRAAVHAVANLLLEKEAVTYNDLKQLLGPPPGRVKESLKAYVEASA